MSRIYLSAPDVRSAEREALLAALDGGWIAPIGPDLDGFEADLAAVTGRGHGVGLASGTAAIHLALHDLGIGPGDQVLVSSFTFAGSAFPVVHAGATPVFVDCEATTWNLSPDLLADELEHRRRAGTAMPARPSSSTSTASVPTTTASSPSSTTTASCWSRTLRRPSAPRSAGAPPAASGTARP